jgi:hypothetical protein
MRTIALLLAGGTVGFLIGWFMGHYAGFCTAHDALEKVRGKL